MKTPNAVLLLSHSLDLGGSERQMTEVAKGLDRREFAPHVATFHPTGSRADELRAAGVPVLHLAVTSFASPSVLQAGIQLIRYLRRHRIKLVHSFDVPLNIFAVPFARIAHGPAVLSSQRAHRNLTPGIYTQLLRITDRMVDGIVVNCVHMRDHLAVEERVSPELIKLCYNGVDLSEFNPEREPAMLPEPVAEDSVIVGVVCALRPEKGLSTLVEGFAQAHNAHPSAKLLIVGSGPILPELQAQAERLGIRGACLFVPKTADVAPWMRVIEIFVLPSLSEALSNSLMEAMACGSCCVASRVGGNPELLGQDTRGILFPRGDSAALGEVLERLLADRELRLRFSRAGQQFIREGFSRLHSVSRMGEIYRSFLQ